VRRCHQPTHAACSKDAPLTLAKIVIASLSRSSAIASGYTAASPFATIEKPSDFSIASIDLFIWYYAERARVSATPYIARSNARFPHAADQRIGKGPTIHRKRPYQVNHNLLPRSANNAVSNCNLETHPLASCAAMNRLAVHRSMNKTVCSGILSPDLVFENQNHQMRSSPSEVVER
jgi:hypothetical protein